MHDELARLLAEQLGLCTYAQARRLGLSKEAVLHRVQRGEWERVRPGLYRLRGSPASWHQSVLGSVLAAGPNSWASHATAARVWGFAGFERSGVEVTVLMDRRPRVAGVRVHRSGTLEAEDLRVVERVPVLSVARTVADLSSRMTVDELGRFVDEALRRRVVSLRALDRVVRRLSRIAPGRSPQRMAAVLATRVPGYEPGGSALEERVRRAIREAGLPEPVAQHRVVVDDRVYFVDFAYPSAHLAIEVDGFEFHRERGAFDADRSRQNDLVRVGLTVLRFTSRSTEAEIASSIRAGLFGRSVGL